MVSGCPTGKAHIEPLEISALVMKSAGVLKIAESQSRGGVCHDVFIRNGKDFAQGEKV
jgi:hypothetical protein